jgi:hypothetical protein
MTRRTVSWLVLQVAAIVAGIWFGVWVFRSAVG